MRSVLIVGGNRFCGSLVTQKMFHAGYPVTVLNRTGTSPVKCNIIKSNRDDFSDFGKYEVIIDMCLYTAEQATRIVKALKGTNIKQYIFTSSIASKVDFFGEYGKQKALAEAVIYYSKLPYVILRPTYIIGKNDHHQRLLYYVDKIMNDTPIEVAGDGNALLSFVFVEDLAEIIYQIVEKCIVFNDYDIRGNDMFTLNNLVKMFFSIMHKQTEVIHNSNGPFQNKELVFPNTKVKKHLNIKFKPLSRGIKEFYKWYKLPQG